MSQPYKSTVSKARMTVFKVLLSLDQGQAPGLIDLLTQTLKKYPLDDRDFRFAREMVFGTVRNYLGLSWVLDQCLDKPLEEQYDQIELIIIMGLFQIFHLERVPDHAIVDETVELVRFQKNGNKFTGLANAILRRVIRERDEWIEKIENQSFTIRYSVPDETRKLIAPILEDEKEEELFWKACQKQAPVCVRLRTMDPHEFDVSVAQPCELSFEKGIFPDSVIVDSQNISNLFQHHGFSEGWWTIEDEGAQLAAMAVSPRKGEVNQVINSEDHEVKPFWILDACSSPGGKCAHWADHVENSYYLALDVSQKKLDRLRDTMTRLQLLNRVNWMTSKSFWLHVLKPEDDSKLLEQEEFMLGKISDESLKDKPEVFDAVLVDAPCSGFGTLRRHPEIRYRRTLEDVIKLRNVQLNILERAYHVLKNGGSLNYIVCTITKQETIDVVEAFSALHPNLLPDNEPDEFLSSIGLNESMRCKVTGGWRFLPHVHGCDGFFAFRWIKSPEGKPATIQSPEKVKEARAMLDPEIMEYINK